MTRNRPALVVPLLALVLTATPTGAAAGAAEKERPLVQLAILLDTSSSMDGLIDQARTQLWRIVNEFVEATRDGQRPELQLALFEYGNDRLSSKSGYIRKVTDFTGDLDAVSEKLFALTTNGGSEYCGQVIQTSLQKLEWSRRKDALRVVFIAGNEPFTQGPVDFRKAIAAAKESGILVNTIHCGDAETGASTGWQEGAVLAGGRYLTIDQNREVVYVPAPQDEEIARLGAKLNETYVRFGNRGGELAANQAAQDMNAVGSGYGSMVQRSISKSSGYYSNSHWDLVDAWNDKKVKLEDVDKRTLPEALRKASNEDIEKHLAEQQAERARIQKRIQTLNEARKKHVAAERERLAADGEKTLDEVIIDSIREQAMAARFRFE